MSYFILHSAAALFCSTQFWICILCLLIFYYYFTKKSYNLPPRPESWPIVGNLFSFPKDATFHDWCEEQTKIHGPVFRITAGHQDFVILNDIASAEEALLDHAIDFSGRARIPITLYNAVFERQTEILGGDSRTTLWKSMSKLFTNSVRYFTGGKQYERRILEAWGGAKTVLDEHVENGSTFDPGHVCNYVVLNNIESMCFQNTYSINDPELKAISKVLGQILEFFNDQPHVSDILPILNNLPFDMPDARRARRVFEPLQLKIKKELDKQRLNYHSDVIENVTQYIIKLIEDSSEDEGMKEFTDFNFYLLIVDIYLGMANTSRLSLYWIIFLLAKNPQVQQKLHEEIQDTIGQAVVSAVEYKERMPYSQAVLLEALRISSVLSVGLPRTTLNDTKICGYDIPANTVVMIHQWAINHDKTHHDKSDEFIPERFLADDGNLGPRPKSFVSFGLGRRYCPGESAAKITMWMFMVLICQRYKILPPGEKDLRYELEDMWAVNELKPYNIKFQMRE